jgi:hypothetical protein
MSTAPGLVLSDVSQQLTGVDSVVDQISGLAHQVATRNGSPSSRDETICHGGTCRSDALEMTVTPLESLHSVAFLLVDFVPRFFTADWMSAGPPLFTICAFVGSVTTLAFTSAFTTATKSL